MKKVCAIVFALGLTLVTLSLHAMTTNAQSPRTAQVYVVNILPLPLTVSYARNTNQVTTGPAVVQPGQTAKILTYSLAPKQASKITTQISGTIPDTQMGFSVSLAQNVQKDGTPITYTLLGTSPSFQRDWATLNQYQNYKITLDTVNIFFDYIAKERSDKNIDIYYAISPKQIALQSNSIQAIIGNNFESINALAPRIWKELFSTSASALKPLEPWIPIRPEIRYDQSSFLGTHASFANEKDGFLYTTQAWSIEQQLNNGIRVLQLTIYPDEDNPAKFCLSTCAISQFLTTNNASKALDILKTIKKWLDANEREVLTIMLTSNLSIEATFNLLNQAELMPITLIKELWEPNNHSGAWPRIGWMQLYKKRLVIFDHSDKGNSERYAYPAQEYLIRNTPGTTDISKAAVVYGKIADPKPRLFQCNYYNALIPPLPLHNSPEQIKKLVDAIRAQKYIDQKYIPNFIMLDHVEMGNPMTFINDINKAAISE